MKKRFTLKLMLCLSWVWLCCLVFFHCPVYSIDNNSEESVNAFIKDSEIDGFMLTEQSMSAGEPVNASQITADVINSSAGCPADYPVDCGNGYCCPSSSPVCGTGANVGKCSSSGGGGGGGCPADYPVDCGNGYCCPSSSPVCGTGANVGKCSSSGGGGGGGCPADYPIDCGNGYCCPSSYPVCGTGANEGKCSTDGGGGGCPADYPIDCGNGYCCPSSYPVCGTGANEGKCSTGGGGRACVAETILQDDEESLNVLRDFRDKMLLKTEKGKKVVELYYEYSPILIKFIEDKPGLKAKLKQMIKTVMPGIKKAL